jgi:cytochrome c
MRLALALCVLPVAALAQEFFTLKGHGGPIMDIAVEPSSGAIVTASFDNSIGFWLGRDGQFRDGHDAAVITLALSDHQVFSGGDDFTVRRWDEEGGQVLYRHMGKVTDLAIGSDGTLASASWDGSIGVFRAGEARFLTGHRSGVNAVAFSRDASLLYSASSDGTLRIWDVASGQEKRQLLSHGFGINQMVVNEGADWIAYGAVDGVTRLVGVRTGDRLMDFTLERRPILAMTLAPDGKTLAVGDGEGYIMIIDTERGRITRDFRAARTGPIWALAFSKNGQNIHAGGLEDVVYSWPLATLTEHGQMNTEERSFLRDPDDMENGERQFARKCSICHTLAGEAARRAGPTLSGLFGRRAGTVPGYLYSETLRGSDIIWADDTIDALFDIGPDHYIPGSKMPMQRIVKAADRRDLIDFLRRATRDEGSK